ncbi:Gfo/Idh/MocA family protein [Staphylococcus kloosii]|jgi:glucose-6-phosphate 3-dehydrogenase|uniref:Gfo/Idh/MocA family protein n=1 Tax=Staphylococcus kloosii TaxID=29384 RepID=UPI00189D62B2|nr:Gfo/Idh/MocA family oxidoreductase [Staphylococcus kloosii]MBF7025318.1 Gfo/Idh/MocA family oxidoreductase [Staphylococcus kloosii]
MIKYGIIGTGGIARTHADISNNLSEVNLYGAYDIDYRNLENFCSKYNTNSFKDINKLLAEIDVAIICSPNFCHVEHIIKSLENNCDVLCEKPLTISLEEANILKNYKEKNFNIKAINLNYRNLTVVKKITELLEENRIGEIISVQMSFLKNSAIKRKYFTWRDNGKSNLSSGALGDLGIHLLDLSTFITKSHVKNETIKTKMMTKVKIKGESEVQVDDHSETFYMTNSGKHIHIETSKVSDESICGFYINIIGCNGELKYSSRKSNLITIDTGTRKDIDLKGRKYKDPQSEFYGWKDSFYFTHKNLLKAIKERNNDLIPSFQDGLRAQELLEYCTRNHSLRKPV